MVKVGFVLVLVCQTVCVPWGRVQSLTWSRIEPESDLAPPARRYSAMAWNPEGGALYVFGGEGSDGALGDTWEYSLFYGEWEQKMLDRQPRPRYGFVSGVIGPYWYISHGRDSDGEVFNDTWAFSFVDKVWTPVSILENDTSIPKRRSFSAGGSAATSLWLSMGIDRVNRKLSDTWILEINGSAPTTGKWRLVSTGAGLNQYNPSVPHARSHAAGIPLSSQLFALSGGCASGGQVGGPCPLEDSWVLDSSSGSWNRLSSCPLPSSDAAFSLYSMQQDDVIILLGGTQERQGHLSQIMSGSAPSLDEFSVLNTSSLQWTRTTIPSSSDFPSARSSVHLAVGPVGMYLFGGESLQGTLQNDLWRLEGTLDEQYIVPCSVHWFSFLHLHGIIMSVAWGLLLPFGALMGRYYRMGWPVWFVVHIFCQVCGTFLTLAAFVIVFFVSSEPSFPHGVIGIILMVTITQQFLTGLIRPWAGREDGRIAIDYENKESLWYKWRRCWEVYHGVSGVIAVALGFTQVTLGVFLIVSPTIVWSVWLGMLGLWCLVFLFHETVHCRFKRQEDHIPTKTP